MRTRPAAIAVLATLTLAGCSQPADNPPATSAPKPGATAATEQPADDGRAALEKAVRAYSTAYFGQDMDAAHGALSKRCATKIPRPMYEAAVKATVETLGKHEIKTLTVDQISGDLARVSYTYDVPKLSQSGQPWAREDGAWKYDAC
jgi:predicted outer membrane protein